MRYAVLWATGFGILLGTVAAVFFGVIPTIAGAIRELGTAMAELLRVLAKLQAILPAIIGAILAAILALLFNSLLEYIKRRIAKGPLVELFIADLETMWRDVDHNTHYQEIGTTFVVRGVPGLKLTSEVQAMAFETYNIKLYESEGFKLAPILCPATRLKFWATYRTMREVEATRVVLKALAKDDTNRESICTLFVGLNKRLQHQTLELVELLNKERSLFKKLAEPFFG